MVFLQPFISCSIGCPILTQGPDKAADSLLRPAADSSKTRSSPFKLFSGIPSAMKGTQTYLHIIKVRFTIQLRYQIVENLLLFKKIL